VLQMKNLLFNMMVWHSTARSEGGDWMDASGKITVNSPAFRTALEGITAVDAEPGNIRIFAVAVRAAHSPSPWAPTLNQYFL